MIKLVEYKNKYSSLSREMEGMGPMKSGNQYIYQVLIPTDKSLEDEV